jgi:hypothetical protein
LAELHHVNVALVHAPLAKQFADWQISRQETAWVAILDDADEENSLTAIGAGASPILWEGYANDYASFAQPLRAARRCLQHRYRDR